MSPAELETAVARCIEIGLSDDEQAHSIEDSLRMTMIEEHCPDWVIEQIRRLYDAPFARWCA